MAFAGLPRRRRPGAPPRSPADSGEGGAGAGAAPAEGAALAEAAVVAAVAAAAAAATVAASGTGNVAQPKPNTEPIAPTSIGTRCNDNGDIGSGPSRKCKSMWASPVAHRTYSTRNYCAS